MTTHDLVRCYAVRGAVYGMSVPQPDFPDRVTAQIWKGYVDLGVIPESGVLDWKVVGSVVRVFWSAPYSHS